MAFVYLITDLDSPDTYKIGVTKKSVEDRLSELQTGNSSELSIVNYYETKYPYKIEAMLHRRFKGNNIKNEWFNLSIEEASSFISECKKYEAIIESLKDNPFFD